MKYFIPLLFIVLTVSSCTSRRAYYTFRAQEAYEPAVRAKYFQLAQQELAKEKGAKGKKTETLMAKGYGNFISVTDPR